MSKTTTAGGETVEELTAAGYEAYNVTADNYEELQETLKTDFADMGLDPEGSYIVVISGEDEPVNSNSRLANLPDQDFIDDGGGESFAYQYRDRIYTMRYMTVAATESHRGKNINLRTQYAADFTVEWLLRCILKVSFTFANVISGLANDEIGSLAGLLDLDLNHTYSLDDNSLLLSVYGVWTHKYIQILNENTGYWKLAARAEYVNVEESLSGSIYDYYTAQSTYYHETKSQIVYSLYYNDSAYLKEMAASCYYGGATFLNRTGNIDIFMKKPDGTTVCVLTLYEGF